MSDEPVDLTRRREALEKERLDAPFFTVLERPQFPDCDHQRLGVILDTVTRTAHCQSCDAPIDPFDALLFYARAEERLVSTRDELRRHAEEEVRKKQELEERKPFVRKVGGYSAVYRPQPPAGDGALYAYDVRLEPCGHTVRWPSRGRRSPKRHLMCEICLRAYRAKQSGAL